MSATNLLRSLAGLPPRLERLVVLGSGRLAREIIEEIEVQRPRRYSVAGLVEVEPTGRAAIAGHAVLGSIDELDRILSETRPDRIVVALDERRRRLPARQLLRARILGMAVEPAEEVYERVTGKVAIESLTPGRLVFGRDFRFPARPAAFRRLAGRALALAALVLASPIIALIALAVKLDSRGPVFFVQERLGTNGRRFPLVKFRTMRPARGETSEWVRDNGHRITRVGRWLRKFRLDELPQLANVVKGEMCLIGPRPHPASNHALLATVVRNAPERGTEIPYYTLRSMIPPGITGWAQVRYGYANGIEEEIEKLKYDLYYVKNGSLALDLRIVIETIKIVLLGQKSECAQARRPSEHSLGTETGPPRAA